MIQEHAIPTGEDTDHTPFKALGLYGKTEGVRQSSSARRWVWWQSMAVSEVAISCCQTRSRIKATPPRLQLRTVRPLTHGQSYLIRVIQVVAYLKVLHLSVWGTPRTLQSELCSLGHLLKVEHSV